MTLSPETQQELRSLGFALGEAALDTQQAELLAELLAADPGAGEVMAKCLFLRAMLEQEMSDAGKRTQFQPTAAIVPAPTTSILSNAWSGTISFFTQEVPFACLIATVIMSIALAVCSQIYITHHQQYARTFGAPDITSPRPLPLAPLPASVARITGMVDVEWGSGVRGQGSEAEIPKSPNPQIPKSSNPESRLPSPESRVPNPQSLVIGDRIELASGLLQLTYNSGAKVILQGPCTYEVNSPAGGFLSLGKLTARVDSGQWTVDSAKPHTSDIHHSSFSIHHSPNPQSPIPNPLFVIRTPTAVITDLGTEFGVEVDANGQTMSHVFRGAISIQAVIDGRATGAVQILRENESARVKTGVNHIPIISLAAVSPERFICQMPHRKEIDLFNTGMGIKEGQADPHWQIVAISNEPDFQPRQAIVTSAAIKSWLSNEPSQSQWISLNAGTGAPNRVVFTFRTVFGLAEIQAKTARLDCRFIADNYVRAIRLNGREIPVPNQSRSTWQDVILYDRFYSLTIKEGFVSGKNSLEFDVENGTPDAPEPESPLGLRVELKLTAYSQ